MRGVAKISGKLDCLAGLLTYLPLTAKGSVREAEFEFLRVPSANDCGIVIGMPGLHRQRLTLDL